MPTVEQTTTQTPFRNRIKGYKELLPSSLLECPWNWRLHPDKQKKALQGILNEIGIADVLLAREVENKKYMLIDGHLRLSTYPSSQKIPVLILDIDEAEHKKLLATLDPLAALATADKNKFMELARDLETGDIYLPSLWSEVAEEAGLTGKDLSLDIGAYDAFEISEEDYGKEDSEKEDAEDKPKKKGKKGKDNSPVELMPSQVRMVQLFFNSASFSEFSELLDEVNTRYHTNSPTDGVLEAMREVTGRKTQSGVGSSNGQG